MSFQYFLWRLYIFKASCKLIPACSFPRLHNCCGEMENWDPVNRFNHTSWVSTVTQSDRPKFVRNRCVNDVFDGVFVFSYCFLDFSVGVEAFVIGLSQISYFVTSENRKINYTAKGNLIWMSIICKPRRDRDQYKSRSRGWDSFVVFAV